MTPTPSREERLAEALTFLAQMPPSTVLPRISPNDADEEIVLEWPRRLIVSFEGIGTFGYAVFDGTAFQSGKHEGVCGQVLPMDLLSALSPVETAPANPGGESAVERARKVIAAALSGTVDTRSGSPFSLADELVREIDRLRAAATKAPASEPSEGAVEAALEAAWPNCGPFTKRAHDEMRRALCAANAFPKPEDGK